MAVEKASDYLNIYATPKSDYQSISVTTFLARRAKTSTLPEPEQVAGYLPKSLKGLLLIDGVQNYVRYNYYAVFFHSSPEEKKVYRSVHKIIRQVYNRVKEFSPG